MAGDIHQRIQECFRLLLLVFCFTSFPPESGASRLCIIEARARARCGPVRLYGLPRIGFYLAHSPVCHLAAISATRSYHIGLYRRRRLSMLVRPNVGGLAFPTAAEMGS